MDFNTPAFLFIFLPVFLLAYFLFKKQFRKWVLLFASLAIYVWFQRSAFFVIIGIVLINYLILWIMQRMGEKKNTAIKILFISTIILDISILVFFKLFSTPNGLRILFLAKQPWAIILQNISYPLGLSFIIFQVISCLVNSYRAKENFPQSLQNYATYLLMFPKILMGPIARYNTIDPQFETLDVLSEKIIRGSKRFIRGLAKKILIADQLAVVVNAGFDLPTPGFSTPLAWFILLSFSLQIYFDFSGYIDMGIGIAAMMGISLPENFNAPYLSRNISEFWRRWHMTLMAWFKDYVFYPLEFKRRKTRILRQETNTMLVFILTGLWHGLNGHYLAWGLLQGLIIVFENSTLGKWMRNIPVVVQRFYFIFAVLMSWVLFRSPSLQFALRFFRRLFIVSQDVQIYPYSMTLPLPIINNSVWVAFIIGIVCLLPIREWRPVQALQSKLAGTRWNWMVSPLIDFGYIILLITSLCMLAVQTFVPSIYGKF
jgi:alginate O-acetyltransferase complex protein AlgI